MTQPPAPGPFDAIRDAVKRLKRGMKRAKPRASYAQYAEDLVIGDVLGAFKRGAAPGTYVDVGANEPRRYSNTWRLYQHGWSGIAVEPDADLCRRFARARPRDAVVCAALGEREEELVFHRFYESALNTLDASMAARAEREGWRVMSREPLRLRTLDAVLAEHVARIAGGIDLLSIDAEGLDTAILRGLDLARHRPRLIVFEVPPESAPGSGESSALLAAAGYRLRARLFNSEMWMR
ncbi:MAG: FkbM family methyltransferase [Phycisphaerales bacterium]